MTQVCTFDGSTQLDGQVVCLKCGHPCQTATVDTTALATLVASTGGWITQPRWRNKTQPERKGVEAPEEVVVEPEPEPKFASAVVKDPDLPFGAEPEQVPESVPDAALTAWVSEGGAPPPATD